MSAFHISFANEQFRLSARQLRRSAQNFGLKSTIFTPYSRMLRPLRKAHPDIMASARGVGYWLWKPYLVLQSLNQMSDGDFLLYTDAGVDIAADPSSIFSEIGSTDVAVFRQHEPLAYWTKRDAFVLTGADAETYWNTPILNAAFMAFRASEKSRRLASEWFAYCADRRILTDDDNVCGLPNLPGYKDHRHDQSILSIVAAKHDVPTTVDPVNAVDDPPGYVPIFDHHRRRNKPFLAGVRSRLQIGTKLRRLLNIR